VQQHLFCRGQFSNEPLELLWVRALQEILGLRSFEWIACGLKLAGVQGCCPSVMSLVLARA
jgi:hypothetical protein